MITYFHNLQVLSLLPVRERERECVCMWKSVYGVVCQNTCMCVYINYRGREGERVCVWVHHFITYMHSFWYVLKHGPNWLNNGYWLVCAPLGIHLEPIKQRVNAVSNNIIIINCAIWPKERTVQRQIRSSLGQWCTIWAYQM